MGASDVWVQLGAPRDYWWSLKGLLTPCACPLLPSLTPLPVGLGERQSTSRNPTPAVLSPLRAEPARTPRGLQAPTSPRARLSSGSLYAVRTAVYATLWMRPLGTLHRRVNGGPCPLCDPAGRAPCSAAPWAQAGSDAVLSGDDAHLTYRRLPPLFEQRFPSQRPLHGGHRCWAPQCTDARAGGTEGRLSVRHRPA